MSHYDPIIIGAGHNGLVAAAYLAKQGKKVLVLERRAIVGGSVVTEFFGDDFKADSIYAGGTLRPDIIKDLKLASHGLAVDSVRKPFISLQADGNHLTLDAESIKRISEKDAARWPEFVRFMDKARTFLRRPIPPSCRACQRTSASAKAMAWPNGDSNCASRVARTCSTSSAPCR